MDSMTTRATTGAPLLDVQGLQDERGIDLQRVGISRVDMPIALMQKDGKPQTVSARATMGVGLPKRFKGTHMSRFVDQLATWSRSKVLSLNLREFLSELLERLVAPSAYIDLQFRYYIEKKAPITDNRAPMGFECSLTGSLQKGSDTAAETYQLVLGVTVPIATLCPCSKAISDYGAHNQRAELKVKALLDTETEHPVVWIEDLVAALEECASCPVYPFLKRADEKYVTERQYDNPKFVEDVAREAIALLRRYPSVKGFSVEVEALESIHGHNAWTAHSENLPQ